MVHGTSARTSSFTRMREATLKVHFRRYLPEANLRAVQWRAALGGSVTRMREGTLKVHFRTTLFQVNPRSGLRDLPFVFL